MFTMRKMYHFHINISPISWKKCFPITSERPIRPNHRVWSWSCLLKDLPRTIWIECSACVNYVMVKSHRHTQATLQFAGIIKAIRSESMSQHVIVKCCTDLKWEWLCDYCVCVYGIQIAMLPDRTKLLACWSICVYITLTLPAASANKSICDKATEYLHIAVSRLMAQRLELVIKTNRLMNGQL